MTCVRNTQLRFRAIGFPRAVQKRKTGRDGRAKIRFALLVGIATATAVITTPTAFASPVALDSASTSSLKLTNTLSQLNSDSPYLKAAADEPVAWQPWGKQAFDAAQRLGRPVFLDLGVMWSHWCGVMDRQNYRDAQVARQLNDHFVCIRVDSDERPDIDKRYRRLFGMMFPNRSAGQPLLLFLTDRGDLFFASSYLPREDPSGRSFTNLLEQITKLWDTRRKAIEAEARHDTSIFASLPLRVLTPDAELTTQPLQAIHGSLLSLYDPSYPGFGPSQGPRFPAPWALRFLLLHHERTGDFRDLKTVLSILNAMERGAIVDPLDGGLHRYTVDGLWLHPRFEELLGINAAHLEVLAAVQKIAPRPAIDAQMRQLWGFIQRRLDHGIPDTAYNEDQQDHTESVETSPGARGFAAAIASDPPNAEPESYWCFTPEEVHRLLPKAPALLAELLWGIPDAKSDSADWTQPVPLRHAMDFEEARARMSRYSPKGLRSMEQQARRALLRARDARPSPPVDPRRFTAANARLVQALWPYADVTWDDSARQAALNIVDLFESRARRPDGLMAHEITAERSESLDRESKVDRIKEAKQDAIPYLADQAAWVVALLETWQATGDAKWLRRAEELARATLRTFQDPYGITLTDRPLRHSSDEPTTGPIVIPLILYEDDGAPGPISMFARGLVTLWEATGDDSWRHEAERLLRPAAFAAERTRSPYSTWGCAVETLLHPVTVHIIGSADNKKVQNFRTAARSVFLPGLVIVAQDTAPESYWREHPGTQAPKGSSQSPFAYIESDKETSDLVNDPDQLRGLIHQWARTNLGNDIRDNSRGE